MLAHNPAAPEEFISVCMAGIPLGFNMNVNECILRKEGTVKSLEKCAVLALAEEAMKDERKEERLKRIIATSGENSLNRLIFGDCPPISKFIMSNISPRSNSTVVRITLSRIEVNLAGVGIEYVIQEGDNPQSKFIELLPCTLRDTLSNAVIFIDRRLPRAMEIYNKVLEIGDQRYPHLKRRQSMLGMEIMMIYGR